MPKTINLKLSGLCLNKHRQHNNLAGQPNQYVLFYRVMSMTPIFYNL